MPLPVTCRSSTRIYVHTMYVRTYANDDDDDDDDNDEDKW